MKPLRIAVIGAGYWGPNLVRNIQSCPNTRLEWVCDLDEARARKAVGPYSTVAVTDSLDTVLDDPRVEAVAIATPADTHTALALRAFDADKHVLVEKPLAPTVEEGEQLVEAAAARGLTLMCDHTYCYTPAVRRIRELVDQKKLGEIQYFDSIRVNLGLVKSDVDVFWDLAPHDLSILDFVLPGGFEAVAVSAHGIDPIGAGHPCLGYLTLNLSSGAIAHVTVNWLSPTKIRTTIIGGDRRIVVWDDLNPSQRLSMYDKSVAINGALTSDVKRERQVSYRVGDMVAPALTEAEALGGVVDEFAHAVREGRPSLTDGLSGLRVLSILEAAGRSLNIGGAPVPVAPVATETAPIAATSVG
jgi:predicted dehydrogenase